ncbi:MAG: hemerythrin domain-containing protein [Nitrospiraceae bacterium]
MVSHTERIDARATFITLMLHEDHQKIEELFDQFDETTNTYDKRNIVTAALTALEVHAKLEEEVIYPAWREHVNEPYHMDEAIEEHHVVHLLIEELNKMDPEDKRYDAKFRVLSGNVRHHIEAEERHMLSQVEKAKLDWDRLTTQVLQRRLNLEQKTLWLQGIPVVFSANETARASRSALPSRSGG